MSGSAFDPIPRQEFDAATLTTSYQAFDVNGLGDEAQVFKMLNNSDIDVDVSFDGTVDHDFIPAGGAFVYDFTANKERTYASLRNRQLVFLKAAAAGTGKIYLMGYTQRRS